ncbi:hypothetical protein VZT92_010645 [Zoarces viviparus]|uniref:Uncharacterized protein n=1 Tax=Zoarces viviparus TaxID=48416 RepID=A0AAW1F999_ZOAVI
MGFTSGLGEVSEGVRDAVTGQHGQESLLYPMISFNRPAPLCSFRRILGKLGQRDRGKCFGLTEALAKSRWGESDCPFNLVM